MQPKCQQLAFVHKDDREELKQRIVSDWAKDSFDLEFRIKAAVRWIRLWRAATDDNPFPEQEESNFHIPLVLWQILQAVAKELAVLFGDDNEIVVTPRGRQDAKRAEKVRRWMNWRVRESLKLYRKYYDFAVLRRIFGTAIAYTPWVTRKRQVKRLVPVTITVMQEQIDPQTQLLARVPVKQTTLQEKVDDVVEYDGLDLIPENIEDWVVPKSARKLEVGEPEHFIRRLTLSVNEILDLRDRGVVDANLFDPEGKFLEELYRLSKEKKTNVSSGIDPGRPVRLERDAQSGVPSYPLGSEDKIVVHNWIGAFRLRDAQGKREERATQVVAFFLPDKMELLGAARLVDMFPDGRLPFIKTELIRDPNRFWGIGVAELLESINMEMDAVHNITTDAGLGAVGPVIGYKPQSGFNPEKFAYAPRTAIPLNDPKNDLVAIQLGNMNVAPYVTLMPQLLAMAERLMGLTETQMGRQFSGPNAPRTYGQQALLQSESNQRLFLDLNLERETFREFLHRVWEADKRYLPMPFFFRVTEEDGGDVMTPQDFEGDFDFDIGPPSSIANRGQAIQDLLQAIALIGQSPLGMQNPAIMIALFRKLLEKYALGDVAMLMPDPEKLAPPQSPQDENARLFQGEVPSVNPADNHAEHIAFHNDLKERVKGFEKAAPGILAMLGQTDIIGRIDAHIAAHQQAMKTQGGSINMLGRGAPMMPGMAPGGMGGAPAAPAAMPPAISPANPAGAPGANALAGMLNSGGVNLG